MKIKANFTKKEAILIWAAYFVFFMMGLSIGLSNNDKDILFCLVFFILVGIFLLIIGKKEVKGGQLNS